MENMKMSKWQKFTLMGVGFLLIVLATQTLPNNLSNATISTFSIVAMDPENGDLGVAVASKFFGVGVVVPWAKAGVGAVATQAFANTTYGPRGLALLEEGVSAGEVLTRLVEKDEGRDRRQVGIVDSRGTPAAFTGSK